jgi:hypothetical protein
MPGDLRNHFRNTFTWLEGTVAIAARAHPRTRPICTNITVDPLKLHPVGGPDPDAT